MGKRQQSRTTGTGKSGSRRVAGGQVAGLSETQADVRRSPSSVPRASLVLLAFNQERYIEGGIRSALDQDYGNLEIVISDDCSTDSTFEIAREIVGNYSGPHDVVLNRTVSNRGVVEHFYEAIGLCTGQYIVGAAADDLSLPNRVTVVVEHFLRTGADAVFSNWNVIDEHGRIIREGRPPEDRVIDLDRYFPTQNVRQITGVTSAFAKHVFEAIPQPGAKCELEDLYFTLMLHLRSRRVEAIDEALVLYRRHSAAVSHRTTVDASIAAHEAHAQAYAAKVLNVLEYFDRAAETGGGIDESFGQPAPVDLRQLRADIAFQKFRTRWTEASAAERLRALGLVSSMAQLRWLAPRLFGLAGLRLARRVRDALCGQGAEVPA